MYMTTWMAPDNNRMKVFIWGEAEDVRKMFPETRVYESGFGLHIYEINDVKSEASDDLIGAIANQTEFFNIPWVERSIGLKVVAQICKDEDGNKLPYETLKNMFAILNFDSLVTASANYKMAA